MSNSTGIRRQPRSKLTVVNPRAAGIDIGSRFHVVAIPCELEDQSTRQFGTFTGDLLELATWLKGHGITTVAMESTGIYWIPAFEILVKAGIAVDLVNARHVKSVPGRKSDINDAQWLQQLHSYGLLRGSILPEGSLAHLRSYVRTRENLARGRARYLLLIQKALMQMNMRLHHVVTDVMGETGSRIITSILAGERDPLVLAEHRDARCKQTQQTIAKALEGNYEDDHLFELENAFSLYNYYSERISRCEDRINELLQTLVESTSQENKHFLGDKKLSSAKLDGRNRVRSLSFNPRPLCAALCGRDMMQLPGMGHGTLLTVISECGTDMRRWPTAKHFTSWLGLAPRNKVSGGRLLSSGTAVGANPARTAFWMAAQVLARTQTSLGGFQRRLAARIGRPKAIIATARKLAELYYRALRDGISLVDPGLSHYEAEQRQIQINAIKKRAQRLGLTLTQA
jgi:transposase